MIMISSLWGESAALCLDWHDKD